jgi:hypothetical protein
VFVESSALRPSLAEGGDAPARASSLASEETESARIIALNMALSGTPRDEASNYLREHLGVEDEALLDDVYREASRSGQ